MEARRSLELRGLAVVACTAAALLIVSGTANADEVWDGDVDGNSINVSGEETSEAQEVSNVGDEHDQGASDDPGGPVVESLWASECTGLDADGLVQDACSAAFNCPQNGPGLPLFIRLRLYQRELDPVTGEPVTGWQHVGTQCVPETLGGLVDDTEQESGPSLIQLVTEEWERVRIPAARLGVNPVGGRTLVNFDTIFFTDGAEQSFPVTVLGRSVTIYAMPVEFIWHYGDGVWSSTVSAGAPYPSTEITHMYLETGEVSARVDVRYRAEFTVDGGERVSIPGVAEVTGTSEDLVVLEARTRLVEG